MSLRAASILVLFPKPDAYERTPDINTIYWSKISRHVSSVKQANPKQQNASLL